MSNAVSDARVVARPSLSGTVAIFTVRAVMLCFVVVPLFAPIIKGYGWHGYADFSGALDLDNARTCSEAVAGSYYLQGNPRWVDLGNTYKYKMATVAGSAFLVAVLACFSVSWARPRTPFITHLRCWLLLNWLHGVALCFERSCRWCADSDDESMERYCSPLWQMRSMLTASLFAYLTFLIRMRHLAGQSALPEKAPARDSILGIFRLQVLILLFCLLVSVLREVRSPGSQYLSLATDLCLILNVVLTAASMCFSLHLIVGQLRVAEKTMKSTSGRRQLEAQYVVKSVRRQVVAHSFAFVSDILFITLEAVACLGFAFCPDLGKPAFFLVQDFCFGEDMVINSCLVLSLSGLVPRPTLRRHRTTSRTQRQQKPQLFESEWDRKVTELANRGLTLGALLDFYMGLGVRYMPHFDPDAHSTDDVVRQAIIPLTAADATFGPCALATKLMEGRPIRAQRMVTHTWGNKFADLIAAVVADALDQPTYEAILPRLRPDRIGCLIEELEKGGGLNIAYWICAASVNQHASICSHIPKRDTSPVTRAEHAVCSCSHPKWLNVSSPRNGKGESIPCEMNKFEDMMIDLAKCNRDFRQVIACDREFQLFTRSWCIAEIHVAHEHCMRASLIVHSAKVMARHRDVVEQMDVRNMSASRPEDKAMILRNIEDPVAFNDTMKWILFDEDKGLFKDQGILHTAEKLGRMSSRRCRPAETPREELGDPAGPSSLQLEGGLHI